MSDNEGWRRETLAAHSAVSFDPVTGAVAPPVYPATTFARDAEYGLRGATSYSRSGGPAVEQLEATLGGLEGGADARVFSSGMSGIAAIFETVPKGRHVVAPTVMYYGTREWIDRAVSRGQIEVSWYDAGDDDALATAVRPGHTDLVWIETPSNPTWSITDIERAAAVAHQAGARLAIDATMLAAVTCNPIRLGADLVFHSATKYLNGHSDVLAGAVITARDDERWRDIAEWRGLSGAILGPMEAWLMLRGLRTVFLRYRQASASALAIARHFETDPRLEGVLYPGLERHPGHAVAARQMRDGFSGMLSLLVRGDLAATTEMVRRLRLIIPATSLGGVESLAEHRKLIEPEGSPVPDNLVRLSIGIEATDDLIGDIDQALG